MQPPITKIESATQMPTQRPNILTKAYPLAIYKMAGGMNRTCVAINMKKNKNAPRTL